MKSGKENNKAMDALWELVEEVVQVVEEVEEEEVEEVEDEQAEEAAGGPEGLGHRSSSLRSKQRLGGSRESASNFASAVGSSVGSTINRIRKPLWQISTKMTGHMQPVNQRLTAQLESLRAKFNRTGFRYGNQGQWPTFGEFALIMDRAGAMVVPCSYLVFGLILFGAAAQDNTAALAGLIPFTAIALFIFFLTVAFQVQRCRHFKQLQLVRPGTL